MRTEPARWRIAIDPRRRFALGALAGVALALGLSGCGSSGEKGLTTVKGRVTLDGGPWPAAGQVTFVPVAAGEKAIPSTTAPFDPSGSFTVFGGYGGSAGLRPGTYKVAVQCSEGDAEMPPPGQKPTTRDVVPAKYRDAGTSGFEVKVEAQPVVVNLDVKSK